MRIQALIDTGAARSLIADKLFQEICARTNRPSLLKPTRLVCGLGGKPLDILGETELTIPEAGPINIMVTRGLPHQLMLGSDAMAKGHGIINYEKGGLQWYGQHYALKNYPDYAPNAEVLCVRQTGGHKAIDEVINEYKDVFSTKTGVDPEGYCDLIPFTIDTGDARPIRQRPYRVPLSKRKVISDQISEMLQAGIIEPSTSPWASPITLVPKGESFVWITEN